MFQSNITFPLNKNSKDFWVADIQQIIVDGDGREDSEGCVTPIWIGRDVVYSERS